MRMMVFFFFSQSQKQKKLSSLAEESKMEKTDADVKPLLALGEQKVASICERHKSRGGL